MSTGMVMPALAYKMRRSPQFLDRKRKVSRALFGIPNPNETRKFWVHEMKKHSQLMKEKYDFDFENGVPTNGEHSKYEFVECKLLHIQRKPVKQVEESQDLNYYTPEDLDAHLRDLPERSPTGKFGKKKKQDAETKKEAKQTQITDFMVQCKRNITEKIPDAVIPSKKIKYDVNS